LEVLQLLQLELSVSLVMVRVRRWKKLSLPDAGLHLAGGKTPLIIQIISYLLLSIVSIVGQVIGIAYQSKSRT